jgi:ABC-type sugar transport system ATPase subunit
MGENGAGKSTLMKVLSGVIQKDSGKIFFDGAEVTIENPIHAQKLGISIIHQELNLAPNMTIYENVFMGMEKRKGYFFIDKKGSRQRAAEVLAQIGMDTDVDTLVKDLSIAQRQMVEIAKAVSMNAKLIIMDEPTSSLTEIEIAVLKKLILKLKDQGVSIVFISHKIDEVIELSDRVTVLRDGIVAGTLGRDDITRDNLIKLMVGRVINDIYPRTEHQITDEVLRVENLSTKDLLKGVSFSVRKGEILGLAGLIGAGRTEMIRAMIGLDKKSSGTIYKDNKIVDIRHPSDALKHKIAYAPEDRKLEGLILNMTIRENTTLSILERINTLSFINRALDRSITKKYMKDINVVATGTEQPVGNLSGGNQQKVVIGKVLATEPDILILDEPTRGVDVGAKKEIHSIINELAGQGMAIIIISSELPEILGMSDRIIVMHEGEVKGEIDCKDATQENILHMAINS